MLRKGQGEGHRKNEAGGSQGSVCQHGQAVVLWEALIICRGVKESRRGQRSAIWPVGVSVILQSELWKQTEKRHQFLLKKYYTNRYLLTSI